MKRSSLYSFLLAYLLIAVSVSYGADTATASGRWQVDQNGIYLPADRLRVRGIKDHLEMSGRSVDLILEWGIGVDRDFMAKRRVRWPMLRTAENNIDSCFEKECEDPDEALPLVHDQPLIPGTVMEVGFDGIFTVNVRHQEEVYTTRRIFPASSAPVVIDLRDVTNRSGMPVTVTIPDWKRSETSKKKGLLDFIIVEERIVGSGEYTLNPGESRKYAIIRSARLLNYEAPYLDDPEIEYDARLSFLAEMKSSLNLETPDSMLNMMFYLSKVRAVESVFSSRGAAMPSSGGRSKHLAVAWSDEQAQYTAPLLPYIGNKAANEAGMEMFRLFAKQAKEKTEKLPAGIYAEGNLPWSLSKDRGDAAMVAQGAGRFALASGNPKWGKELYPLIQWCLRNCENKIKKEGLVASETDDLEGRGDAGTFNIRTNTSYYDALVSASCLAGEVNDGGANYARTAVEFSKTAVDKFITEIPGRKDKFLSYAYAIEGEELVKKSFAYAAALPLMYGIQKQAGPTTDAILEHLWTRDGVKLSRENGLIRDRYTLQAFQGMIYSGNQDKVHPYLVSYSTSRLLGDHVPYAVDNMRFLGDQLAPESALYCRLFIEGIFGVRPVGYRAFSCTPRLPKVWDKMTLNNVKAFGSSINIIVERVRSKVGTQNGILRLTVTSHDGQFLYRDEKDEGAHFDVPLPL